jgi:hypothetical protein
MIDRWARRFLVAPALVLALPPAFAQTLARFEPAPAAQARVLELRFVREGAEGVLPQPWPEREAGWLFVREEGTQRNHETLAPLPEDATRLFLERMGPGAALVGWDLPPRVERMSPAELGAFLEARAGRELRLRALAMLPANEPVPVQRLESLALLAGPQDERAPAEPSAIAISKAGQRMELRALFDPTFLQAGSDFAFKLYVPEGGPEDVVSRAVQLETRETRAVERLPDGSLRARLDRPGAWMLEASRVRALDAAPGPVLELASATLVFTVRAGSGWRR